MYPTSLMSLVSLVTLLPTPTTRYMPWSSSPLVSRPARQSCTKLNPDSSRNVWLALLGFPPGVWAYLQKKEEYNEYSFQTFYLNLHGLGPIQSLHPQEPVLLWLCLQSVHNVRPGQAQCAMLVIELTIHLSSGMMSKQNLLSMASAAFLIQDFSLKLSVFVIFASRWLYGIIQNVLGDNTSALSNCTLLA